MLSKIGEMLYSKSGFSDQPPAACELIEHSAAVKFKELVWARLSAE
jgi:hypothetical protein